MNMAKQSNSPQTLLDADELLRAAADKFGEDENDETTTELRQAALAFAGAWHACNEPRKGRP